MARGRKKTTMRNLRLEAIRGIEAVKFLNVSERTFYRLVEMGYIRKHGEGVYYLGEVMQDFLRLIEENGNYYYLYRQFLEGGNEERVKV
ncbi:MAG: hypothetical protein IJG36_08110 [Synergistaceae bacterium]|nr:hypothetical protein [Synergistaceae bacterium]